LAIPGIGPSAIKAATSSFSIQATIRIAPSQSRQILMSIPNTRLRRCAK
jgi:hypothetical protein